MALPLTDAEKAEWCILRLLAANEAGAGREGCAMIDAAPDTLLTMRQTFELYYEKDELSRNTLNGFRHNITCWERLSGDSGVRSIENATMTRFRTAMLEAGYSHSSVNTVWKNLRAILRRIGPAIHWQSVGLGIIAEVPAMKTGTGGGPQTGDCLPG